MASFNVDEVLCIAALLEEEEREEQRVKRRFWVHPSLRLRLKEGEFHTLFKELLRDEEKFFQYFRMSFVQHRMLLRKIASKIRRENTQFREALSPTEKLAVCLRFLATGDSFRTIAFSYRLGESPVRGIVKDVCQAVVDTTKTECLPTPTREQWETIADQFWEHWNFPTCLGALDGKHVQIKAPKNSGTLYYNYKKSFSIVLLALVDANYKFVAVDVGAYGKNSDGGIFANSRLGKAMAAAKIHVPEERALPGTNFKVPFAIVVDEALPLKEYIMRPYPGAVMDNEARRIFNYRLSRARRVVENAFGILAQKFRIYDRRLNVNPEYVNLIVMATCVLHNFILGMAAGTGGTLHSSVHSDQIGTSGRSFLPLERQGGCAPDYAFVVREIFANYFRTPQGAIEWQNNA